MKTVDSTGSVISGTMRVQDVLPAMMEVLLKFHPDVYQTVVSDIFNELGITYTELCDNEDHLGWQCRGMTYLVHETAWNAMDEIAPEGYYFGAHPGDGSDYGFWKCIDDEEPYCYCCGRSDLTLLTCPRCGDLLCQDCLDTDAHECEPE